MVLVLVLVVVVTAGREIVPPGSLNGGGTIIVVDLPTVEPCVKIVDPPGLEVVVVGMVEPPILVELPVLAEPPVLVLVVVESEIVPPGSLNGGGTTTLIDPSGGGPCVKIIEPPVPLEMTVATPDVKDVVVVPVMAAPEDVGETYPLGCVIGGSTGCDTTVSPCDWDK